VPAVANSRREDLSCSGRCSNTDLCDCRDNPPQRAIEDQTFPCVIVVEMKRENSRDIFFVSTHTNHRMSDFQDGKQKRVDSADDDAEVNNDASKLTEPPPFVEISAAQRSARAQYSAKRSTKVKETKAT
jgi:hypothetical protein